MTPRVLVRPMHGTHDSCWRWRCEACTNLGRWTTADNAHDDGRAHARNCAALKYAQLAARIRESNCDYWAVNQLLFDMARAV